MLDVGVLVMYRMICPMLLLSGFLCTLSNVWFDMLLIMTDRLTNYVCIVPMRSTATARDMAQLVYESWYRLFGLPHSIVSDRDKLFTSHFWKELHRLLDIRIKMSTTAHPEKDGSSERSNKTAIEALRNYVNRRQTDWMDHLIHVETAMNNSVNATTKMTPTQLLFGTSIRLFPSFRSGTIDTPVLLDYSEQSSDNMFTNNSWQMPTVSGITNSQWHCQQSVELPTTGGITNS